jgi:NAD(P)-dependent dehydrogenase (short-subunit alcohol dehydrogenase family)
VAGRPEGKVVFISGDARGQGAAEGQLFAREGAKVVLGDGLDDDGNHTVGSISAAGGAAMYVHPDVTTEADWKKAIVATQDEFGQLNVLVNNAGILRNEGAEKTTLDV